MSLEIWNKLKSVPADALKIIEAGRLKGKHDISPAWRYERMTEIFGQCGIGWKYEIESIHWVDAGPEKMLFVQINLYVKDENKWSAPIPGVGGDFAVQQERTGLHSNDEALKMAVTDALGYAMQKLGVAANVYRGKADDSKYGRETQQANTNTPAKQNSPAPDDSGAKNQDNNDQRMASQEQRKKIEELRTTCGWSVDDVKAEMALRFKVKSSKEMTLVQANELIDILESALKGKDESKT